MRDGKHCPKCGTDIGLWPIMKAGLPNMIRCPNCGARLRYLDIFDVLIVTGAALIVLTPVAYYVALALAHTRWKPVFALILFGSWTAVEIAIAICLRSLKILDLRAKQDSQ